MRVNGVEVYGIIYKITNKINGKSYIGQTIQEDGFDIRYKNNLENNTHNERLKNEIHKYGIENFNICKVFDIAMNKQSLDELEDYYICLYDCIKNGYNNKRGNSHGKSNKYEVYKSKKYKEFRKGKNNPRAKKVICLTTGKIFDTTKQGGEFYNIDSSSITKCCKGKQKSRGKLEDGTKLVWSYFYETKEVVA